MKLGIVITSNEPETVWNAFRFGLFARKQGDAASVFLPGHGVEVVSLASGKFDVAGQMRQFSGIGGQIMACGTCLKLRPSESTDICPVSTLQGLYAMVSDSDKVLTF